jgi:ATP-dependent Lhr-like helicase
MEMQGLAMRGVLEHSKPSDDEPYAIEWCERRILHRIHRLTLGTLRKQVEPVSPAVFMRWLLDWHHLAPQTTEDTKPTGEEGVLAAIEQLEGFEAPAVEWERTLLPARVDHYDPRWLDNLCLAGVIGWGRISPHPAWGKTPAATSAPTGMGSRGPHRSQQPHAEAMQPSAPRRVIPTNAAPITFYLRESAEWLHAALAAKCVKEAVLTQSLSAEASQLRCLLAQQGACFTADLQRLSGLTKLQTTTALWELATAGLASADGFDQLRSMMDPRRKSAALEQTAAVSLRKRAAARTTAGRWSLLIQPAAQPEIPNTAPQAAAIAAAKQREAALDAHARILLGRYGVLFRELLTRESNAPKWRDLVPVLRRLEARGEIRGGRFVSGPFGEQYALPEVIDSLRAARKRYADRSQQGREEAIPVAGADPLNLAGILVPGDRVPAVPGQTVEFVDGAVRSDEDPASKPSEPRRKVSRTRSIADLLRAQVMPVRPASAPVTQDLFS